MPKDETAVVSRKLNAVSIPYAIPAYWNTNTSPSNTPRNNPLQFLVQHVYTHIGMPTLYVNTKTMLFGMVSLTLYVAPTCLYVLQPKPSGSRYRTSIPRICKRSAPGTWLSSRESDRDAVHGGQRRCIDRGAHGACADT